AKSTATDITAQVPHPFFFNSPRTVTGRATGLAHNETAIHANVVYAVPSKSIDLLISGGPSLIRLGQDVVDNVAYSESYPYDTATFTKALVSNGAWWGIGWNAGADASWKLSRRV